MNLTVMSKDFKRGYSKSTFVEERRGGRGGGGVIEKRTKTNRGSGVLVLFWKKMLRFSKWSFIVIFQFFLLIIMAVWNIKQTIMKDYNVQSCQSWLTIAFASPHKITIMWFMLKIFIYNLLWLAEYQFKGVVKFNLSDLFFWVQFRRPWKRLN